MTDEPTTPGMPTGNPMPGTSDTPTGDQQPAGNPMPAPTGDGMPTPAPMPGGEENKPEGEEAPAEAPVNPNTAV